MEKPTELVIDKDFILAFLDRALQNAQMLARAFKFHELREFITDGLLTIDEVTTCLSDPAYSDILMMPDIKYAEGSTRSQFFDALKELHDSVPSALRMANGNLKTLVKHRIITDQERLSRINNAMSSGNTNAFEDLKKESEAECRKYSSFMMARGGGDME